MADEVEGTGAVAEWAQGVEDEGLRNAVGAFDSHESLFKAIGYEAPKAEESSPWGDLDEDLGKVAERFATPADALRSVQALQKRESQARVPGKDASDEDRAAYLKAIGVPETADAYDFGALDRPKDMSDEDFATLETQTKESRAEWGSRFHELNIPQETAVALGKMLNEDIEKAQAAEEAAHQKFVDDSTEALKKEWGAGYEKNKTIAERALEALAKSAGVDLSEVQHIHLRDGLPLFDDPRIIRILGAVGREMQEGSIGPTATPDELETMNEQLTALRTKQAEAQAAGNSKQANALYQKEQALIAKMKGSQPIVGSQGRAA